MRNFGEKNPKGDYVEFLKFVEKTEIRIYKKKVFSAKDLTKNWRPNICFKMIGPKF